MIEIFNAVNTRGFRPIWLCEELGIPYKVTEIQMAPEFRNGPEWRALSPTGKVPIMKDGDLVMFESCAMVEYLLAKHGNGRLQPAPGTPEHAEYLQWCWFSESTYARPIGEIVNHRRAFGDEAQEAMTDEMKGRARVCAAALDTALEGKTYLLGDDFSAADIMMAYSMLLHVLLVDSELSGNLKRYWETLQARPAYQALKAMGAVT